MRLRLKINVSQYSVSISSVCIQSQIKPHSQQQTPTGLKVLRPITNGAVSLSSVLTLGQKQAAQTESINNSVMVVQNYITILQ